MFLKVPKEYRLLILEGRKMPKESGLFAFVFLLDFCLLFENIIFKQDEKVLSLSGMGVLLPVQKAKLSAFLQQMRMCIIQVIDRIASTQLGSSREEAVEYQRFIIPKEGRQIIKMPKSGKRFPDLSRGSSWRAATVSGCRF